MERRVVITGLGPISALGAGAEETWRALVSGTSGTRSLTAAHVGHLRARVGGQVRDFEPGRYIKQAKNLKLMSRPVSLGVAAAALAYEDSGLPAQTADPVRLGAFIGSRGHASDTQDLLQAVALSTEDGRLDLQKFGAHGTATINPMWLLRGLSNIVLYFVSLNYNAQGMNANICTGGTSGTQALGEAFKTIKANRLDLAFVGAYDSLVDEDKLETYNNSNLIATAWDDEPERASRPFDARRDGFVPAEGAGFLVLEELGAAERRRAKIYAEVVGYGAASAAGRPGGFSADGFATAMRLAIKDARIAPEQVSAVYAHGLATPASDRAETAALKEVFGQTAYERPVTAAKSMLGNSGAASGALEAIAAALSVQRDMLPPTINYEHPDPDCDLDYVPGAARPVDIEYALLNNANLGGGHAALIFKKWRAE